MKTSETLTKIIPALLKAQAKIEAVTKTADNPYFSSKYATLADVMDACKKHLNDNDIFVTQPVVSDETGEYVETTLFHSSGEFMSSRMKLMLVRNDMQSYGSAVSYAKRYALQSMLFIASEDDDGNASVGNSKMTVTYKNGKTATKTAGTPVTTETSTPTETKTSTNGLANGAVKTGWKKPVKTETPKTTAGDDW